METFTTCLILGIYALVLAIIGRRLKVIDPIILVLGGLALSAMPFVPVLNLEPKLVLEIFLPPVLYHAALGLSWRELRTHIHAILQLAVGLVIATAVGVAFVAHAFIPGMTFGAALVLGAIVSPPDAVAANAVLHKLRIPRRIVTILEGESLINDATALVFYALAVSAVVKGGFTPSVVMSEFLWVSLIGLAIGLAIGKISVRLHRMLDDPLLEAMISLAVPFTCFALAEHVHASGVLAVVAAGLLRGAYSPRVIGAASRLQITSMWNIIVFVLNALGFLLIGTQISTVVAQVNGDGWLHLVFYAFVVCSAVILIRFMWIYPVAWLTRALSAKIRQRDPMPPHGQLLLVGWSGMRGIVSLVAALALPKAIEGIGPFPSRDMILFLTYCVILTTLVGQGSTLAWLAHKLKLESGACTKAVAREARARLREAGLQAVRDSAGAEKSGTALERLAQHYERMIAQLRTPQSDDLLEELIENDGADYRKFAHRALRAERATLLWMMRHHEIEDELARELQQELDMHEILIGTARGIG